tara:strand:- start:154 stop:396 length:243 start_codon:yes stop_codon:yes gene_type:complete
MNTNIKEYCKFHKLKFNRPTSTGFIASKLIPIKAGMEINLNTGNCVNIPIRIIGKKRIYSRFKIYPDKDIVSDGIYNNSK